MLRSILAVVGGYITLIIGVTAFFAIVVFFDPDLLDAQTPPPGWLLGAEAVVSVAVALIGGYVTGWLAPDRPFRHGAALAALMLGLGAISVATEPGLKPLWSSLFVALVPPAFAALGAQLRARAVGA